MSGGERREVGDRAQTEATLREWHERGDFAAVVTFALRCYGPEVLGFLVALRHDPEAVSEIFSQFCEDLWAGVPRFAWESSFRTWAYVLARHAMARHQKDAYRRRRVPLSEHPALFELEQQVRTQTMPYLRTDVKQRAARLREKLDPDDQALLVLRVDRNLSWNDIARVLAGCASDATPADLAREAAALRKRFERVKAKLKGLLAEPPDGAS
ncbi:MAG: sigma-70 family RNA polymerase sigma factor [Polyangiaceae bacterium]|jgi:RNA polymerase sigma-70 factor (ECF subfamily)|nr:sigma-70 family RNA polymerase sigma factor [Polyangiaceae bacterium]